MIIVDNTPVANPFDAERLSKEITDRFFEAIEKLIKDNKIRSIRNFCMVHNFNYPNVMRMSYPDFNRKPTFELLFVLHHFYKVNLSWVITGEGDWRS